MLFYGVTIFLSAFLLFQVQLVIAKYILPWFGGTPAVWTTCMLFFQLLLLGGYAYSHLIVSRLRPRRQGTLHLVLLAGSLCLLAGQLATWRTPLLPPAAWKPTGSDLPVLRILGLLAVSVGLPYFILTTTSSLLQAWFAGTHPGRSPYRLYALSNAGSLLGLISYPFLVEPALALKAQAGVWSGCYAAFVFCCGWCAVRAARTAKPLLEPGEVTSSRKSQKGSEAAGRPSRSKRLLWLGLPACASVLLLATTNHISEEVAVIPFLWVVPLGLYLLSFIFCFNSQRAYSRRLFVVAALAAMVLVYIVTRRGVTEVGIAEDIWIHSFALFVCCMICHGELVALKPAPRHLTSFYLSVAAGGALGGVFVALVAPTIFTGLWELPLGYLFCGALLLVVTLRDPRSWLNGRRRWVWRAPAGVALAALVVAPSLQVKKFYDGVIRSRRNFYGILRVREEDATERVEWHRYVLRHARTVHGFQFVDPARRRTPTTYYGENSGAGLAILNHPRRTSGAPMRIGVVGLGVGTLAAYGRKGDIIRFYEINPAVVELATGPDSCFTYVQDSAAKVDVVLGDARILMQRELEQGQPQQFDVLALDAFSGDSPPVHLLTREAFDIYLRHLRRGGVLAVHASNRYVNLAPVIWRAAEEFGLACTMINSEGDSEAVWGARWILLTHDKNLLKLKNIAAVASGREESHKPIRLWTDDYSNLLRILK